jgi:hypothetical protein
MVDEGTPPGAGLAELGVRWVVVQKTVHLADYAALTTDPDLRVVIDAPQMAVYEVTGWVGDAITDSGSAVGVRGRSPAWVHFSDESAHFVIWNHPAGGAWRRGWSRATATADGRLQFGPGGGPVWNMATVPSLVAQCAVVGAVVFCAVRARRRRPIRGALPERVSPAAPEPRGI